MKPHDEHRNGNGAGGGSGGSDSGSGSGSEEELSLVEEGAPARALAALNALRKSRQHYDVLVVAGGAEVAAHRAVLAAASPYLLQALRASGAGGAPTATYRAPDVAADALRTLVEYAYTGRARVRDAAAARRLYRAAWRLRVEPVRAHLAARLTSRAAPADCLDVRALPDLEPEHLAHLDAFIAENFEEVCESGALAALPCIRVELLRESSASGGDEAPLAVAEAALAWLVGRDATLEELAARPHLLYVNAGGALRDCGELPPACGDAPELQHYRAERERERARASAAAARPSPAPPSAPLPTLELGERLARAPCAVLAARATPARATRALLELRGRLAAASVTWRDGAGAELARGGPLGGAPDGEGERRARMALPRCALGVAELGGRLVACGGYDRGRVLRAAEAYDPATNTWAPLAELRGPRARFPAARLGARVYLVGGSDGQAELDSVEALETGVWVTAARVPGARSHAAAAADEARGALYAVGGWAGGRGLRRVDRYSPATNAWSEAPALTAARSQGAAVVWEGALWALGGCDAWRCLASTERLPLGDNGEGPGAWEAGPPLPTARRSMGGAEWRGRLVSAGGSDGAASLRRTEWLAAGDARGAGGWLVGPPLRRARAALGLAVLADALYAVGGFDGKEFLSCVECLYSPDGEWTTLVDPPRPSRAPSPPPAAAESDREPRASEP